MAKAKDLAKIAALGALGYMLSKGKGDSSKTDTGDETERLAKRGESRRQITDYMKKAPEAEDANYGNEGRRTSMGVAPAPKTTTKAAPKLETITTRKDPRSAEAGMSRGTRTMPNDNYSNEGRSSAKPQSTVSSSEEGMKNYKPRRTPSVSSNTVSSSEEGMKNYKPRRITPDAGAGRGFVNPPVPKPADPRSAEAGMSRGTRTTVPPFKGGQKGYDEAGNFMGGQRGFDEAGNPMKKGGMVKKAVKKMASGGMTSSASKRADGIATKGKTKCKMY